VPGDAANRPDQERPLRELIEQPLNLVAVMEPGGTGGFAAAPAEENLMGRRQLLGEGTPRVQPGLSFSSQAGQREDVARRHREQVADQDGIAAQQLCSLGDTLASPGAGSDQRRVRQHGHQLPTGPSTAGHLRLKREVDGLL
jgi:hypothetical protein